MGVWLWYWNQSPIIPMESLLLRLSRTHFNFSRTWINLFGSHNAKSWHYKRHSNFHYNVTWFALDVTELQLIPIGRMALFNAMFVCSMPMSYDGCTSGPREYCGFIGKQLANYDNESTVSCCAVAGNLPDLPKNVVDQLSTNQKYLFVRYVKLYKLVIVVRKPGKILHSRWLTYIHTQSAITTLPSGLRPSFSQHSRCVC